MLFLCFFLSLFISARSLSLFSPPFRYVIRTLTLQTSLVWHSKNWQRLRKPSKQTFNSVCERRVKSGCQSDKFRLITITVKLTGLSHKQNKGKGSVASAQRAKQKGAKKIKKKHKLKTRTWNHFCTHTHYFNGLFFLGGRKCERKRRISTVAESFVGWRHGKLRLLLFFFGNGVSAPLFSHGGCSVARWVS